MASRVGLQVLDHAGHGRERQRAGCRARRRSAPCPPACPWNRRAAGPSSPSAGAWNAPAMRPTLARTSSAASGLRFCGMIEEPVVNLSDRRDEAELRRRPDHDLLGEARQVHGRDRRRRQASPARSRGRRRRRASWRRAGRSPAPRPSCAGRSETTCRRARRRPAGTR